MPRTLTPLLVVSMKDRRVLRRAADGAVSEHR
jgi:hypothetical protein